MSAGTSGIPEDLEEPQLRDGSSAVAKRKRTDEEPVLSIEEDVLLRNIKNVVEMACQGSVTHDATDDSTDDIQSLRTELKEMTREQTQLTEAFSAALVQMQAETGGYTAATLERLAQQVHNVSKQTNDNKPSTDPAHVTSKEIMQSLRNEVREDIARIQAQLTEALNTAVAKMQTDAERRAEAMLQRLEQKIHEASERAERSAASSTAAHKIPGPGASQELHLQPEQRTWANVTRTATQTATGWATVASRKRKPKKHPLEQRRILFARNSQPNQYDARDIMFEVNKALAHARADVTRVGNK